jgi:hypothetical protein
MYSSCAQLEHGFNSLDGSSERFKGRVDEGEPSVSSYTPIFADCSFILLDLRYHSFSIGPIFGRIQHSSSAEVTGDQYVFMLSSI